MSFFVIEIFTFLYYGNEESDDVIGDSTKTVKHSIENNSRNIDTVFFKLGTSNVNHKRNTMTPTKLLPWKHSWLHSICNLLKWANHPQNQLQGSLYNRFIVVYRGFSVIIQF